MKDLTKKVKDAVMTHPDLLLVYLRHFKKKNNTKACSVINGIVHRMLPYRFSFEFETIGMTCKPSFRRFLEHKGVQLKVDYELDEGIENNSMYTLLTSDGVFNEERVSVYNPQAKSLSALNNYFKRAKKLRHICKGSGTHIHIDLKPFLNNKYQHLQNYFPPNRIKTIDCAKYTLLDELSKIITKKLDRIEEIASGYQGYYNSKNCVISSNVHTWVRIQEHFQSIEFRIFKYTDDYKTAISWVYQLTKLLKESFEEIEYSCLLD